MSSSSSKVKKTRRSNAALMEVDDDNDDNTNNGDYNDDVISSGDSLSESEVEETENNDEEYFENDEILFESDLYESDLVANSKEKGGFNDESDTIVNSSLVLEIFANLPWNTSVEHVVPKTSEFHPISGECKMSFDIGNYYDHMDDSELKSRGEKYKERKMVGQAFQSDIRYGALVYDARRNFWSLVRIGGVVDMKPSFEHIDDANEKEAQAHFDSLGDRNKVALDVVAKIAAANAARQSRVASSKAGAARMMSSTVADLEAARKTYSFFRAKCLSTPVVSLNVKLGTSVDRMSLLANRGLPISSEKIESARSFWKVLNADEYFDLVAPLVSTSTIAIQRTEPDILWHPKLKTIPATEQIFEAIRRNRVISQKVLKDLCKSAKSDEEIHEIIQGHAYLIRGLWVLKSEIALKSVVENEQSPNFERLVALRDLTLAMLNKSEDGKLSLSLVQQRVDASNAELKEVVSTYGRGFPGRTYTLIRQEDISFAMNFPTIHAQQQALLKQLEINAINNLGGEKLLKSIDHRGIVDDEKYFNKDKHDKQKQDQLTRNLTAAITVLCNKNRSIEKNISALTKDQVSLILQEILHMKNTRTLTYEQLRSALLVRMTGPEKEKISTLLLNYI